ncbi:hypothetical protein V2G26_019565 [Clonostachys chloroleuca]
MGFWVRGLETSTYPTLGNTDFAGVVFAVFEIASFSLQDHPLLMFQGQNSMRLSMYGPFVNAIRIRQARSSVRGQCQISSALEVFVSGFMRL